MKIKITASCFLINSTPLSIFLEKLSRYCFENNIKIKSKMREAYSISLKCTLNLRKNQQIELLKFLKDLNSNLFEIIIITNGIRL